MLRHNLPTPTPILPHNGEGVVGARPRPHLAPRGHPGPQVIRPQYTITTTDIGSD